MGTNLLIFKGNRLILVTCDQKTELALGARVLKSQVFKMSLAAFLIFFVEKSTATFGHTFQYSWNIFEP